MKADELSCKDLMVGDWVNANRYECVGEMQYAEWKEIGKVIQIYEDIVVLLFFTREDDDEEIYVKDIEPISLTPEILEKNGFEDIGDDTYQLEEKPCWFWVDFFRHTYGCEYDTSTYEYEDDEHRLKLYGIPSVHELQHALRLCGIEKEIIL